MSLIEKISDLVDSEVNERLNILFSDYANIISKKHQIGLDLLLKDIPSVVVPSLCRGTRKDGQRCTYSSFENGYCKYHSKQGERLRNKVGPSIQIQHTHGSERYYDPSCPACQRSSNNELIELCSIISNE